MSYYMLELRNRGTKDLDLVGTTYDNDQTVLQSVFYAGKSLNGEVKVPLTVVLNDRLTIYKKQIPDRISLKTQGTGMVLFVSPAAQELFKQLNLPVEFYEVMVKGKNFELKEHKIVNIVGRINCTDKEKSKLDYLDDSVIHIYYSLVLDESKIPDNTDIFLLGEDCTMRILVSERLKLAIEEKKLTGFQFVKPEDFKTFRT